MSDTKQDEPRIPRPPTKAELDELSEAQGMITDEWAPAPHEIGPEDAEAPKP